MLSTQNSVEITFSQQNHGKTKTLRKPLQPTNFWENQKPPNPPPLTKKSTPTPEKTSLFTDSNNKENHPPQLHPQFKSPPPPTTIESFDSSLAEELCAFKKQLEKMRLETDKTETMLTERDMVLDLHMRELLIRGEVQKQLENEVDRLYRLNQLRSACMRVSPIRSLRAKLADRKTHQVPSPSHSQESRAEETPSESIDSCLEQSPDSELLRMDQI
ncbi:hypothetical protein RJ641_024458 [Dillenia turbinata]|uniref:Uncharacterized protein n=1 Tax=Dillenia turbinata TaxID=194707 RepID=A0AAN8W7M0_9MAGN